MSNRQSLILVAVALSAVLAGCVAPSPSASRYDQDVLLTLETVGSQVSTADLTLENYQDGNIFQTSANVIVTQADEVLGETAATFGAIEPPPGQDEMRAKVQSVTADAQDAVWAGLVALRRGDLTGIVVARASMEEVASELDELHQKVDQIDSEVQ